MHVLNRDLVNWNTMRKRLVVLPVLAILLYLFRSEIIGLLGINLSSTSLLGIPLLTDWASIVLVVIFLLDLIVTTYSNFLRGPKLRFVLLDEDREFAKEPIPITMLTPNTGIGRQIRLVMIRVENKGPEIAEGCRAYCKLFDGKSSPVELRWRLKRSVLDLFKTVPVIKMERIPIEIQEWFEASPQEIIPNLTAPLARSA